MEGTDVIKEIKALGKDAGRVHSPAPVNLNSQLSAVAAIEPEPLAPGRLQSGKRSYATRRIALGDAAGLFSFGVRPQTGDLVLARIDRIGHHRRIESPEGRRGQLYVGDEVLLCFGARYASDQFEAVVPKRLEPCHMVAAGGIAALCVNRHDSTRPATQITPIGLVADTEGRVLNLKDYALSGARPLSGRPYTMTVVGTSMNAGKTTTIAGMVRGLSSNGLKVAVGKVTGTGAGGDRWAYVDAGASEVLDFTDFGYASTYKVPSDELTALLSAMMSSLAEDRPDVIILELADGLFFSETADLVETPAFAEMVDDVVVAASDAMGAEAGVRRLAANEMVPIALAGRMTSSPLAVREAARVLDTPIVSLGDLTDGIWMPPGLAVPTRIRA
ncbi:MAG: hypothetical protein QNI93_01400 [Kiloniellales bacterium]|nr:hypothetical protein [Kiloniellales bacterium]